MEAFSGNDRKNTQKIGILRKKDTVIGGLVATAVAALTFF